MILNTVTVGIFCKNMRSYNLYVENQHNDPDRRYRPVTTIEQASTTFDEIVITQDAILNSNYVNIFNKVNKTRFKGSFNSSVKAL